MRLASGSDPARKPSAAQILGRFVSLYASGKVHGMADAGHFDDAPPLASIPDLVDAVADRARPFDHSAVADLDVAAYLGMNPDLLAVFGNDSQAARRHWAEHGGFEGRVGIASALFRQRRPDLAAILARPFGVDLHMAVDGPDAASVAGHRLLRALRDANIDVAVRPYVDRDGTPLVSDREAGRAPVFRVSLFAAAPPVVRRLHQSYPQGHFDLTYVIAFWPGIDLVPHLGSYTAFGAVDEVWVAGEKARDRLASVAPVPVRLVRLPVSPLPSRQEARARLGLPADITAIMLDALLVDDGAGALHLAGDVLHLVARLPRQPFLIARADPRSIAEAEAAMRRLPHAVVMTDQRVDGGSLLLAACDAVIETPGMEADLADARSHDIAVLACRIEAVAAFLGGVPVVPASGGSPGVTPRTLLADLGLDVPAPAFAALLGRSKLAALPPASRPTGRAVSTSLPIVSVLLDARGASASEVGAAAAGLAAAGHPFWELCVAGANRRITRNRLAADPRLRLSPASAKLTTLASVLDEAAGLATGSHLVVARTVSEAHAVAASLERIVGQIEAHPEADILVPADPIGCTVIADRVEVHGAMRPVAIRARAFRAAGGFRSRYGPAGEYDLLLRIEAASGCLIAVPLSAAPSRDPDPPGADEAGRLALHDHLLATAGPLAHAEPGLQPNTYRRRTIMVDAPASTLIVSPRSALATRPPDFAQVVRTEQPFLADLAAIATEHVVMIDDRIAGIASGSLTAIIEFLQEQEIGVVGGRVLHDDTTLHHAGLILSADGRLAAPGHGEPNDPAGPAGFAFAVYNPDAVGSVLAIRRSVLLHAGGPDASLRAAGGVTFDLLAADLCLRLARDVGLRTTYTPFAYFARSPARSVPASADGATEAELLFRSRWSR